MNNNEVKIKDIIESLSVKTHIRVKSGQNTFYTGKVLELVEQKPFLEFPIVRISAVGAHKIEIEV